MNRTLRAIVGLIVFAGGMTAGALASQLANPAPPDSPWRALPRVGQDGSTAAVAAMITSDDARSLAKALDPELLQRLASAIDPLVEVEDMTFTGATERDGDILAAYVAGGKAPSGDRLVVGVVFRVRDGKIVGVN
ncbi:MAG: hypothetical protein HYX56_05150 [Chloroflexi bacterium]|nr:hypothetical protein [Chloroflexota bacterium]